MKLHPSLFAPPSAGLRPHGPLPLGPESAAALGGLSVLRGRAGAAILTGVHFDAESAGVCHMLANLA
jgi:hypothetical protein